MSGDSEADDVLAVKDNHPTPRADIEASFALATEGTDSYRIINDQNLSDWVIGSACAAF